MELLTDEDVAIRSTFPQNADIREISCHLAARVFEEAIRNGVKVCLWSMLILMSNYNYFSMLTKKCLSPTPMEDTQS